MAAPVGNQFWRLRSKHGRDTLFADAVALWEAAQEYFEWCDDHPWAKTEQAKGTAKPEKNDDGTYSFPSNTIDLPTQRPYSLGGLMIYCDASESYWRSFKSTETGKLEGFLTVTSRIEEIIATQQFEGVAMTLS